jgi:hypothetical protein
MDKELYRLISDAREACAGCCVKELPEVMNLVNEVLKYLQDKLFAAKEIEQWELLNVVKKLLQNVKEYGDRLEPDQILCDILNEMLEDE